MRLLDLLVLLGVRGPRARSRLAYRALQSIVALEHVPKRR
jgi:hypothetical protein